MKYAEQDLGVAEEKALQVTQRGPQTSWQALACHPRLFRNTQSKAWMASPRLRSGMLRPPCGFLVPVIPGLDPGISPGARIRWDPRIRSGDDDEAAAAFLA
jgi:hypothetical protein